MFRNVALAAMGAFALVLLPVAALAEEVDVTPAVTYTLDIFEAILGVGITVIGGFAAMWLRPFIGERLATSAMDRLERAGRRAAKAVRMRYLDRTWTVEIENEAVAHVADYLGRRLPDAARAAGLTPNGLREFAAELLGEEMANAPSVERPKGYVGKQGLT